eukprot:scaffold586_cov155-Amphora_coffeaeformis.AAC.21
MSNKTSTTAEYVPASCDNSTSNESFLMDTAAGFFKSLTGEATTTPRSAPAAKRPVTPPPTPNEAEASPPMTPISRFRKDAIDSLTNTCPMEKGNDPAAVGTGILTLRSFESHSDENSVDQNHIQQARQAISSVTSQSRLSDDRIHQILLAAMHYQTDQSHTLPSRPQGRPALEDEEEDDNEDEDTLQTPSMPILSDLSRISLDNPLNLTVSTNASENENDEESSWGQISTVSNAGTGSSSDDDKATAQPWHELSSSNIQPNGSSVTTVSTLAHQNLSTPRPSPPQKDKHVHVVTISNQPPVNVHNPPATPPMHTTTPAAIRHLDSPLAAPPSALAERVFRSPEEKKQDPSTRQPSSLLTAPVIPPALAMVKSLSMTESEVASLDGLPANLRSNWREGREQVLEQLDGVNTTTAAALPSSLSISPHPSSVFGNYSFLTEAFSADLQEERQEQSTSIFDGMCWWGAGSKSNEDDNERQKPYLISWKDEADDTLALLGCAPLVNHRREDIPPAMASSLVRVTDEPPLPSFAETILREKDVDYRLPAWVDGLYRIPGRAPYDGSYGLGKSRSVIVHEIHRGDWTWCTVWSPKGDRLAVATENHHLAVIETMSSAVWRVRHDRRLTGPAKNHTTHSVRSIAWGKRFIATGGTGDAVSIISSIEPYPILHVVKSTGFVGSLHWKPNSDMLAIGSRLRKLKIIKVESTDNGKSAESQMLYTASYDNWVNKVAFSPGGTFLAVGVATGELFVYNFWEKPDGTVGLDEISKFKLDDSVMDAAWSPDGKWLYTGGEDFQVTVIDTRYWQIIYRVNRKRWVQCISASNGGTHVAVGGVNSEVSILDVNNGWDSVMGIELNGLVPLSAQWHPKDQAIALTGQSESIIVVETTNARHVRGHHLCSASPILAIEFSPDGRLVLVGNEGGVVTLFSLSKSSFEVVYELVVTFNDRLSMCWSRNGIYAVVGSKDALLILARRPRTINQPESSCTSNPVGSGGFAIQKVVRSIGATNAVSIDYSSRFVAVGGERTIIYDSTLDFRPVVEWKKGVTIALQWSPDRNFLATMGGKNTLTIYDTSDARPTHWRSIFSLKCDFPGLALSWSPRNVGGLQYLAYGGQSNHIYIMEIRTAEHTWETVLRIPRKEHVYNLDWSASGLLAAGSQNGTVAIIDLAYLQCGIPVHEKDYKWQRQALTCFTEIRRNRGQNIFKSVKWIPSAPGSDSLLAIGGTDGEVEIVDLTERKNCRGYARKKKKT